MEREIKSSTYLEISVSTLDEDTRGICESTVPLCQRDCWFCGPVTLSLCNSDNVSG